MMLNHLYLFRGKKVSWIHELKILLCPFDSCDNFILNRKSANISNQTGYESNEIDYDLNVHPTNHYFYSFFLICVFQNEFKFFAVTGFKITHIFQPFPFKVKLFSNWLVQ